MQRLSVVKGKPNPSVVGITDVEVAFVFFNLEDIFMQVNVLYSVWYIIFISVYVRPLEAIDNRSRILRTVNALFGFLITTMHKSEEVEQSYASCPQLLRTPLPRA